MSENTDLERLVTAVLATSKYAAIDPSMIRWIGEQELKNRGSYKLAIKATHARLHQVAAAYQETKINYPFWTEELKRVSNDRSAPDLRQFCLQMMKQHASTRERLPILELFYSQIFNQMPHIHTVLDLACGLNPLTRPWMDLPPEAVYLACDIYQDMVNFLNTFFQHIGQPGHVWSADLTHEIPQQTVDLALMLKTLPCLEQLDKSIGTRLLQTLSARYILVSFPVHSLGGKSKGMVKNYEAHFNQLIAGQTWSVQRFEFSTELAFLITK